MKLIKLLKKLESSEYITISNDKKVLKDKEIAIAHWVRYDTLASYEKDYKIYKSKVKSVNMYEFMNGDNGLNIVIDYEEE